MAARAPLVASCVGNTFAGNRSVLVPWWSITKSCLAACVLVLVAAGRLDLDRAMPRRAFTLRQLLRHTSGLACYTEHPRYDASNNDHEDPWSHEELLAQSETTPPSFPPGQGWAYSNTGYFLVRRLIEDISGLDIERAMKTLVLTPLGVESAFIARTRRDLRRSEWGDEDGFHPGWVAHGLLMGSPADAALFMHALLTGTLLPPPLRAACASARRCRPNSRAGRGGRRAMASA
jgi:D-alanyl-D-alanine carboxypeptidase